MPVHPVSTGKTVSAVTKEVWEGLDLKPGSSHSTGTPGAKDLLSRLLSKTALLGPVCARWLPPQHSASLFWEGQPCRQHLAEAMCAPASPLPSVVVSPLEEF